MQHLQAEHQAGVLLVYAMTLIQKQQEFVRYVADLIQWATTNGYELTFGECYRTPEQAAWNAEHGTGIEHSLHCSRLAIDLNLFRDGQLLTTAADYKPLGEFWKSLDDDCKWGGDWQKLDVDHFSLSWGGVQ